MICSRFALALPLSLLLAAPVLHAQAAPPPSASAGALSPGGDPLAWVPAGLAVLAPSASFHTDFTFDHSMLALGSNLSGLDEPTRQAVARLNAVAVHMYRFAAPGLYSSAELDPVRAQYDALGWKHLSFNQGASAAASTGSGAVQGLPTGHTDLWLNMQGANVAGVVVLLAAPTNVNLVTVSGTISTLDLLRLRGHFGIPRFSADGLPSSN